MYCIQIGKYLKRHNVTALPASDVAFKFLSNSIGIEKAKSTIRVATEGMNARQNRWLLKYLSFGAIILKYQSELDMKCNGIISIGDGRDEATAIKEYSDEYSLPCIHFDFVRNPTIKQLDDQWKYMERKFGKLMESDFNENGNNFYEYPISKLFKADNNSYFTGSKQLKAICDVFQSFHGK